jgi:hypothetical protein
MRTTAHDDVAAAKETNGTSFRLGYLADELVTEWAGVLSVHPPDSTVVFFAR